MKEIWRDIKGYEGRYQASNFGNIRALNFHNEKKIRNLKQYNDKAGYKEVALYKDGKMKWYKVHRLIMLAFVGESNLTVNHKDENKQNNKLDNLEYMTHLENVRYSQAHKIMATDIKTGEKIYFNSTQEVKKYGFLQGNVRRVLIGKGKTYKGYIWEYIK